MQSIDLKITHSGLIKSNSLSKLLLVYTMVILELKYKYLSEIELTLDGVDPRDLYGEKNSKINILKTAYPEVTITSRGQKIKLKGEKKDTQHVKAMIESMIRMLKSNRGLSSHDVEDLVSGNQIHDVSEGNEESGNSSIIVHGRNGRAIKAKTRNQKKMVELSEANDVLFATGPAGTGKTYTAVALAVRALKNKLVRKIIMTRPAVEAGENLGFLPGDLKDKIDPYLRPLYDALDDMIPPDKLNYFMTNRIIEVAPLAFMRGRTLDNAFIILDEAQNATSLQIKMFLTRLGPTAKCIITGDMSQVDLPRNQKSGLAQAIKLLQNIEGISNLQLTANDVVRHRLVKQIILRYDQFEELKDATKPKDK